MSTTLDTNHTLKNPNPMKDVSIFPKLLLLGIFTVQGIAFIIWIRYLLKELREDTFRRHKKKRD